MNRQDIIAMAEECGIEFQNHEGITGRVNVSTRGSQSIERVERLIALAIAKDRERLAAGVELPESKYATTGDIKDINEFTRAQLRDYGDRRAAAEREAAAKVCEAMEVPKVVHGVHPDYIDGKEMAFAQAAHAIRARGAQL